MNIFRLTRAHAFQIVAGYECDSDGMKSVLIDLVREPTLEHELRIVVPVSDARQAHSYLGRVLALLGEEHPEGTMQTAHHLCEDGVVLGIWPVKRPELGQAAILVPEDARAYARELLRLAGEFERRVKETP